MTNEEFIEELLYKAHAKGFYEELWRRAKAYEFKYPQMEYYERVEKAYNKCKQVREKITN
jgi:2-C-methyl-D-erythritol 4-phosphate cytidylyltransferase